MLINRISRLFQIAGVSLIASACLFSSPLSAQTKWPTQPIRIIVPFAPGGGSDAIARFVSNQLGSSLGQPVIVENRPAAGGAIGIELAVKATDGHTLALVASSYAVNASLYPMKYDPIADIAPIVQLSQGPMMIVANPKLPANNVTELIALAKAKPGSITFASAGQGSVTHMAAELFALKAGIKMTHVPYKGTGPALTDTMGGQTSIFFATTATSISHVQSGKLKAIAVTGPKRAAALPNVPTVAESGLPSYEATIWHGLIAPKSMPKDVVARINAAVNKVLAHQDSAAKLQSDGVAAAGGTAQQFQAVIQRDIDVWRKVVKDAGVKVE